MKKLFYVLAIAMFTLVTNTAFSEIILEPQWSEICPSGYENVKASKLSPSKTYWYNRRVQFEQSISRCSKYKNEDLKSCYTQVMEAEKKKNEIRSEEIKAQQEYADKLREQNRQDQIYYSVNRLIDKIK